MIPNRRPVTNSRYQVSNTRILLTDRQACTSVPFWFLGHWDLIPWGMVSFCRMIPHDIKWYLKVSNKMMKKNKNIRTNLRKTYRHLIPRVVRENCTGRNYETQKREWKLHGTKLPKDLWQWEGLSKQSSQERFVARVTQQITASRSPDWMTAAERAPPHDIIKFKTTNKQSKQRKRQYNQANEKHEALPKIQSLRRFLRIWHIIVNSSRSTHKWCWSCPCRTSSSSQGK